MKKGKKHPVIKAVAIVFLLAACMGGAELAACRVFAPELYFRITAPVRQAAGAVCATAERLGSAAASTAAGLWSRLAPAPEPEAEELESQLAGEPAVSKEIPVSDPSITELISTEGGEILTGGAIEIVYFNQGEEPWASQPYGSDQIAGYGCGPTAMAMAVSSMTDQQITPKDMAQWAAEHGYWAKGSGSYLSIVEGTASAYGLTAASFEGRRPKDLLEALASGGILVALMGRGHFTQHGHFILLRGVTLDGSLLVADPNSTERSLAVWDPQLILDELSASKSHGAPLWILSNQ